MDGLMIDVENRASSAMRPAAGKLQVSFFDAPEMAPVVCQSLSIKASSPTETERQQERQAPPQAWPAISHASSQLHARASRSLHLLLAAAF